RPVIAGAEQELAVRRKGDAVGIILVSLEALQLPARLQVPQPDGPVTRGGGPFAVGGKVDAVDPGGVPLAAFQLLAGLQVPEPHGRVAVTVSQPAREGAAPVAGNGDHADAVGVSDA